jgi:Protein of unknown function (DUF3810)
MGRLAVRPKGAIIIALAAAAAMAPMSPAAVDRFYSTSVYPPLQSQVTAISNLTSFAIFDVLIVVVLGGWLVLAVRDLAGNRSSSWLSGAAAIVMRTVVWAAGFYVFFLLIWGLNYRRTPLADKLAFDEGAVTAEALTALGMTVVSQLNRLHPAAHEEGWPAPDAIDPLLAAVLAQVNQDIGGAGIVRVGRPKTTVLDWYFRRTATDGMTDPYFLETLASTALLPFERPFVLAHEWSHLAGLADEGDANFVGWLACVRASPPSQYSGWLFLFSELTAAMRDDVRGAVAADLAAGPRADLAAIRARVAQQISPRLAAAGRQVYDRYLKANRVESGVESYARVVRLVLGVRFGPDWSISRRPRAAG